MPGDVRLGSKAAAQFEPITTTLAAGVVVKQPLATHGGKFSQLFEEFRYGNTRKRPGEGVRLVEIGEAYFPKIISSRISRITWVAISTSNTLPDSSMRS